MAGCVALPEHATSRLSEAWGKDRPSHPFGERDMPFPLPALLWAHLGFLSTPPDDGLLGTRFDEERSEMR
jgi:hypothetical protein